MKKLLCGIMLVTCLGLGAADNQNVLLKAFHYEGGSAASDVQDYTTIDLGKIVLLFPKKPIMNLVPTQGVAGARKVVRFMMPLATIGGRASQKMVNDLNAVRSSFYRIELQEVEQPIRGLQLSITHGPGVSFRYSFFDSIKGERGVVFRFHDQRKLDELDRMAKAVARRVASCEKKKERLLLIAGTAVGTPEPLDVLA